MHKTRYFSYSKTNLDQVREQTQKWMHDYNHKRPHDSLGGLAPKKYAKINSVGVNPNRIKNYNFENILE